MADKWQIEGPHMQSVYDTLDALPLALKAATLRDLHKKAATIIRDAIRSNSPVNSPEFTKQITIKNDKFNKSGVIVGSFDYRTNWFENGTKQRQKKSGANTGTMQPEPFVEKSFNSVVNRVNDFVSKNYIETIEKYLSKYIKRQEKKLKAL